MKRVFHRVLAGLSYRLRVRLRRAIFKGRYARQWNTLMESLGDGVVRSGPFQGLARGVDSSWGQSTNQLLGAYEAELHQVIEMAIGEKYDQFIDIGCAEGYYAIGFAMRSPHTRVIAFDIDENARNLCSELARLNGVSDHVEVRGACTTDELQQLLQGRTLVLSDCEGFELELLDPEKVPSLVNADLIVELHDFVEPSLTEIVLSRFKHSHDIEMIDVIPRKQSDYPELQGLSSVVAAWALAEHRPIIPHPMQWAILRSR